MATRRIPHHRMTTGNQNNMNDTTLTKISSSSGGTNNHSNRTSNNNNNNNNSSSEETDRINSVVGSVSSTIDNNHSHSATELGSTASQDVHLDTNTVQDDNYSSSSLMQLHSDVTDTSHHGIHNPSHGTLSDDLSDHHHHHHHHHHNDYNHNHHQSSGGGGDFGRLAQLTEAEILEMAEIDYASVGNMPPRSVRDEEQLLELSAPALAGLGQTSQIFSEGTRTTVQESMASVTSVGGNDSNHDEIGGDSTIGDHGHDEPRHHGGMEDSPLLVRPLVDLSEEDDNLVNMNALDIEEEVVLMVNDNEIVASENETDDLGVIHHHHHDAPVDIVDAPVDIGEVNELNVSNHMDTASIPMTIERIESNASVVVHGSETNEVEDVDVDIPSPHSEDDQMSHHIIGFQGSSSEDEIEHVAYGTHHHHRRINSNTVDLGDLRWTDSNSNNNSSNTNNNSNNNKSLSQVTSLSLSSVQVSKARKPSPTGNSDGVVARGGTIRRNSVQSFASTLDDREEESYLASSRMDTVTSGSGVLSKADAAHLKMYHAPKAERESFATMATRAQSNLRHHGKKDKSMNSPSRPQFNEEYEYNRLDIDSTNSKKINRIVTSPDSSTGRGYYKTFKYGSIPDESNMKHGNIDEELPFRPIGESSLTSDMYGYYTSSREKEPLKLEGSKTGNSRNTRPQLPPTYHYQKIPSNQSVNEVSHIHPIPTHIIASQHNDTDSIENAMIGTDESVVGNHKNMHVRHHHGSIVSSLFSTVRSVATEHFEGEIGDSEKYILSSAFAKAFPERFAALIVTLIVEIPVLLIISGGSNQLCGMIGRSRYQLLMAFLPLSSAISGNCGLQASTLATRAVSHNQVRRDNYAAWLLSEMQVATYLGFGISTIISLLAYHSSFYDWPFAVTIFVANFVSVVTAGFTGTLAPLIFTFIFKRDSGKWGGPLETAIQDIVGSFCMVVLSYRLLVWLGPNEISADDVCGP